MLISLDHKFIFIANLKAASTSIDALLAPYANIYINHTQCGKHDPIYDIEQKYNHLFVDGFERDKFFVFSSIREPLDFLKSQYFFHQDQAFENQISFTKNLSFDQFIEHYWKTDELRWEILPAWLRLHNKKEFRCDYLINYSNLNSDLSFLIKHFNLPVNIETNLKKYNVTQNKNTEITLSEETENFISKLYKLDEILLYCYTSKILTEQDKKYLSELIMQELENLNSLF